MLLGLVLGACAPFNVPTHDREPFPPGLRQYLSEPWMDRESVHDRLGAPTASRLGGQLEIYVAQRVDSRQFPDFGSSEVHEYHYLMVFYEGDRVARHRTLLYAGCMPGGICINDFRYLNPQESPHAGGYRSPDNPLGHPEAVLLQEKIDGLTVYAPASQKARALEAPLEPGSCRLLLDRDEGLPQVSVAFDGGQAVNLAADGFLTWLPAPGAHSVGFSWTDWKARKEAMTASLDCREGETRYYHVALALKRRWGWRYELQVLEVPPDDGVRAIGQKALILQ